MKFTFDFFFFTTAVFLTSLIVGVYSNVLDLTGDNIDDVLNSKPLIFINFYAEWCRFSKMLTPIFTEAADKLREDMNDDVILARVDCDQQPHIAQKYRISKYPTLKLFRNGQPSRREYRGERSVGAFTSYLTDQLRDPIYYATSEEDIARKQAENSKHIIGYFENRFVSEYRLFSKTAITLRDECPFIAAINSDHPNSVNQISTPLVMFRDRDLEEEKYPFSFEVESAFRTWIKQKCIPLVREITFENGEELTEEGFPFLILFYDPDISEPIVEFKSVIQREIISEKDSINFVTADGVRFAHPLAHLGKKRTDLPVIAIDSFRHMYLFPDYNNIHIEGRLKEFVADLHSGKLHHAFHHPHEQQQQPQETRSKSIPTPEEKKPPIKPPLSTFKNLKPSNNRYSFRDEL